MSRFRRQPRLTDNFSQVPHGLWTAPLSWGAKAMLGWLHSHDERYLASLSNNRIRAELGASGQVAGWIKELTEAGYLAVERNGQRNRFVLLAGPWEALAARRCKDDETEPTDNRPVDEMPDEPTDYRSVTDRLPAGNQPKNGHIEYHIADHRADQLSNVSDIVHEAEIVPDWELAFEAWWNQYPRKKAKQQARRVWAKLSEADRTEAIELLPSHVERWRSEQTAEKYIPYPERWLKHRRWEDELTTDYQPAGSLLDTAVRFALHQQRQERDYGHRTGNGSTREIGRGDDGLE